MKRALVSIIAVALPLAVACSSNSGNDAGAEKEGGATASTSSGSSGGGATSSTSSGATTSSSSTSSSTSSGSVGDGSDLGADCTTSPCTTKGLVCCPAVNVCTLPDAMDCASPVWVACTKTSDCETGQVCCVTPATTTGSGPSGSACRTACLTGNNDAGTPPDQGPACNINDSNGGLTDCPTPASDWVECQQVSNSPASLGLCIGRPKTSTDGGKEDGGKVDGG